jgi:hypothetical protein
MLLHPGRNQKLLPETAPVWCAMNPLPRMRPKCWPRAVAGLEKGNSPDGNGCTTMQSQATLQYMLRCCPPPHGTQEPSRGVPYYRHPYHKSIPQTPLFRLLGPPPTVCASLLDPARLCQPLSSATTATQCKCQSAVHSLYRRACNGLNGCLCANAIHCQIRTRRFQSLRCIQTFLRHNPC